jgi:hypothetical protein
MKYFYSDPSLLFSLAILCSGSHNLCPWGKIWLLMTLHCLSFFSRSLTTLHLLIYQTADTQRSSVSATWKSPHLSSSGWLEAPCPEPYSKLRALPLWSYCILVIHVSYHLCVTYLKLHLLTSIPSYPSSLFRTQKFCWPKGSLMAVPDSLVPNCVYSKDAHVV